MRTGPRGVASEKSTVVGVQSPVGTSSGVGARPAARCTSRTASPSSAAVRYRRRGSRLIAVASTSCSASGTSARAIGTYVPREMRRTSCSRVFCPRSRRSNGLCPASSEYTVAPRLHTSLATVPDVCSATTSGALHGTDIASTSDALCRASDEAMPKSARTAEPNAVTSTLLGLMSRCTSPARCADSRAPARRTAIDMTSSTGMRSMR